MKLNAGLVTSFVNLQRIFSNAVGIKDFIIPSLKRCNNTRGLWRRCKKTNLTPCV